MIFQETWEWVIGVSPYTGEPKTETRRLWSAAGSMYEVGKEYAVQPGRGKKAVGRIKILESWRDPDVRDIDFDSLRREGFDCPEQFLYEAWAKLRDKWLYREFEGYPFEFGITGSSDSYIANEEFWLALIERPAAQYDAVVYRYEKV